jgi:protein-S-isoprenylcysteine O-methyltransferase Ste14
MHALRVAVAIGWGVFWLGWLLAAFGAKRSLGGGLGRLGPRGIAAVAVAIVLRGVGGHALQVHSAAIGAVGVAVFAAGLALAVWARVILGRNWGMPTTQRAEPELITAGPYGVIRHPIYTGILLALVGTALATDLIALAIAVVVGAYFVWAATVEERNLTATFPSAYPAYRARTRMLIPFVL